MAPKGREVFGATSAEQSPSIEPFKTTCLVSTSYLLLSSSNYIARALKHTDCRRRWRRLFAIAPSTLHAAKHTMSNYMTLLIHVCATHTGAALRRSMSLNKSNPYMQDLVPPALSHDALCGTCGALSRRPLLRRRGCLHRCALQHHRRCQLRPCTPCRASLLEARISIAGAYAVLCGDTSDKSCSRGTRRRAPRRLSAHC